jgi:hypothetical protein
MRSEAELAEAVKAAGLRVVAIRHLPSHLPGWNLLERAFARWLPLLRRRIGLIAKEAGA